MTNVDFKTKRHTNPLNPTYKVRDEDNKVVHAGPILGNQPKVIPQRTCGPSDLSLATKDIAGAEVGSKTLGMFH